MNRSQRLLIALFCHAFVLASARASDASAPEQRRALVEKVIDEAAGPLLNDHRYVGLSLAVIDGGKTTFFSRGETERKTGRRPDEHTLFEIGSITKVFTALLLADMASRGLVKLDDPVSMYLPPGAKGLSRDGRAVTLADLSSHLSGLPRLDSKSLMMAMFSSDPYAKVTSADIRRMVASAKPRWKPGSKYEYSNFAVGALGVLLADKAGIDYATLLRQRITEPLEMKETTLTLDSSQESRLAKPYLTGGSPGNVWHFDGVAPAGGLKSSAADMARLALAHLGLLHSSLDPAIRIATEKRAPTGAPKFSVGLGWHLLESKTGRVALLHDGGTGSYCSIIIVIPNAATGVVALANTNNEVAGLGLKIIDALLKESFVPPKPPATVNAKETKKNSAKNENAGATK